MEYVQKVYTQVIQSHVVQTNETKHILPCVSKKLQ